MAAEIGINRCEMVADKRWNVVGMLLTWVVSIECSPLFNALRDCSVTSSLPPTSLDT